MKWVKEGTENIRDKRNSQKIILNVFEDLFKSKQSRILTCHRYNIYHRLKLRAEIESQGSP